MLLSSSSSSQSFRMVDLPLSCYPLLYCCVLCSLSAQEAAEISNCRTMAGGGERSGDASVLTDIEINGYR